MKTNTFDRATDLLKTRISKAFIELKSQFGKSNPYRQEKVSERDKLFDYDKLDWKDIEFARQQFGDELVDSYIAKMNALRGKYNADNNL